MAILKALFDRAGSAGQGTRDSSAVLTSFVAAWERGETPSIEEFLTRIDPDDSEAAVELIYRAICLSESDGGKPERAEYLSRFPRHARALERLFDFHGECSPSLLGRWMETTPALDALPMAGDSIGPFELVRQLGSGGFARVFLARQTDLADRLVVLKVSIRMTQEPWLLARVRHAHIVEIFSHAPVDNGAFHLICMPFWGGATLAAVLEELRARESRPRTGLDLLAALDAVSAPEFAPAQGQRPAREILAALSYPRAIAWLIARLAEALDYAFSRDVAHGDVKPSNILLAADANPLLLDFNLARDGQLDDQSRLSRDLGGTAAYMAPERLRRFQSGRADVAGSRASSAESVRDDSGRAHGARIEPIDFPRSDLTDQAPHRADIYSLGIVMLEALSGRRPAVDQGRPWPSAEGGDGWSGRIAPGLRAILARCLDPEPGRRYRSGRELADDLDRWRTDRPLCFAPEPLLGAVVPRVFRRQRRALVAVASVLVVIAGTTVFATIHSQQALRLIGQHKLGRLWDDPEARALRYQRPDPDAPRLLGLDAAHVETAIRALREYDLHSSTNWRGRDDVRTLPADEHDDLEAWLLEQVYVYCRALADRPNSPDDWRRALEVLDRSGDTGSVSALENLRHHIRERLDLAGSIRPVTLAARPAKAARSWVSEYLSGIEAESSPDAADGTKIELARAFLNAPVTDGDAKSDAARNKRLAALRALEHYARFLEVCPNSFWGHYRAAAVCYGLGGRDRIARALEHLEVCLRSRPNNPTLHHHRAVCLMALERFGDAERSVEVAIAGAPDVAEFYRTRVTIRARLREAGGLAEDLRHFELLTHVLPRALWDRILPDPDRGASTAQFPIELFGAAFAPDADVLDQGEQRLSGQRLAGVHIDRGEFEARVGLATAVREAGYTELAEHEFAKLTFLNPDHIGVRMAGAAHALLAGRSDDALFHIKSVLYHPGLADYVRAEATQAARRSETNHRSLLELWHDASRIFCQEGKLEEGREIARRAVKLAIELDLPRGMSHYNYARAYADSVPTDPAYVRPAALQLFHAFAANPLYREKYRQDSSFDAVRVLIDAVLDKRRDPTAEYERRLAAMRTPGQVSPRPFDN